MVSDTTLCCDEVVGCKHCMRRRGLFRNEDNSYNQLWGFSFEAAADAQTDAKEMDHSDGQTDRLSERQIDR